MTHLRILCHEGPFRSRAAAALAMVLLITCCLPNSAVAVDWVKTITQMKKARASKQQLAVAYNNYAMELSNQKKWNDAEKYQQKAVAYDPRNKSLKQNLVQLYLNHGWVLAQGSQNDRHSGQQAIQLAKKALSHDSRNAEAYLLIGDVEYESQRMEHARSAWNQAQRLDPQLTAVDKRLERLQREAVVENKLKRGGNAYFDLRYHSQISDGSAKQITELLMKARMAIGREFNYWPDRRIVVLIYTPDGYAKVRRGPEWSVGSYDGKIRVKYPAHGMMSTLVHEYTHAVVYDISGGQCPRWLNEGMARYQERKVEKPSVEMLKQAVAKDRFIPLEHLNQALRDPNSVTARLAYEQSYSLVTYLAENYQFFRIKLMLEGLAAGDSLDVALKREFMTSADQLEREWKRWIPSLVR